MVRAPLTLSLIRMALLANRIAERTSLGSALGEVELCAIGAVTGSAPGQLLHTADVALKGDWPDFHKALLELRTRNGLVQLKAVSHASLTCDHLQCSEVGSRNVCCKLKYEKCSIT